MSSVTSTPDKANGTVGKSEGDKLKPTAEHQVVDGGEDRTESAGEEDNEDEDDEYDVIEDEVCRSL